MAKFLSREEVYRILQRELPEGVYPDGAPSTYYSTADMDSVADVAATGYTNLQRIYDNYWPQLTDERVSDWEILVFGKNLAASLTLQQRRDKILGFIRNPRGMTIPDMVAVVKGVIGQDKLVEVANEGCDEGGWVLDVSELDISTYLNGASLVDMVGADLCELGPSDFGVTQDYWDIAQEEAYTYIVYIYGYVLTDAEREEIEEQLNATEPARSQHVIMDNQDPDDILEGNT